MDSENIRYPQKMIKVNPNIPKQDGAYIVGGSIRDMLLNRPFADYDIAVLENPEKFARKVASSVQGRLVKIGLEPVSKHW